MSDDKQLFVQRRRFLRYLAASPLLGLTGLPQWLAAEEMLAKRLIQSPEEALNVFDFHELAKTVLPPAHYGYLSTGVDDNLTRQANRDGFAKYYLRPRRMVDVTRVNTRIELFGEKLEFPILLAPIGGSRAFHPLGELGVARAARTKNQQMIMSTVSSTGIEQVTEARGSEIWYQLYPTSNWEITRGLLKRAENAGCPVVALTVDLSGPRNTELQQRYTREDSRDCSACHQGRDEDTRRKPMFAGLGLSGAREMAMSAFTWDFVRRVKDQTRMKLIIKGIETREDAELCVENGVDGLIISNHGGRAAETGRGTIEILPEVVSGVHGRIPVLVDGGFRRGTDLYKALALGADAIGIGRPYIWGLSTFGQAGVEKVIDMLRKELRSVMQMNGTPSIHDINQSRIGKFG